MSVSIVKDKVEYWYDHVAKWNDSGKTQKEYCLANNLGYNQFKKWRYKFADEFPVNRSFSKVTSEPVISIIPDAPNPPIGFAEVKVSDNTDKSEQLNTSKIKLYIKDHMYLELTSDMDSKVLNKVFVALEVL